MSRLKELIVDAVPPRYQTPWRYRYRSLRGRLDPELFFLRKLLERPRTCVDVGANYGLYTYDLARYAARVEAFEPLPACARALEAHFGPTVRVHRVALSSRAGRATLHTPVDDGRANLERTSLGGSAPGSVPLEVETRTLDDFDLTDVSFVKIDVEGHEVEVLKGAARTIARDAPVLLVEIEQRHHTRPIAEVIAYVEAMGYEGYFLVDGTLVEVARFSVEEHQAPYAGNEMSEGYVNDFFFLPEGRAPRR